MQEPRLQLLDLPGVVGLMGVGNVDLGDDGFGVRLAGRLERNGVPNVRVAGASPEDFLYHVAGARLDHLIFLDAVHFGGAPGSVIFLNALEIQARFPQISTHKLSLGLLARCVESNGSTQVWLLGAQPGSLRPSHQLSPAVERTVNLLAKLIIGRFRAPATV